jgi:predicted nucleic acid-binding protein
MRSPGGASAELLRRVRNRSLTMLVNQPLITEYEAVLSRQEHLLVAGWGQPQLERFLDELTSFVEPVPGWFRWRPQLRDPADELVLEAAANGRADAIVTFNRRDFGVAPARFGVAMLTPGELLKRLQP